jgi:sigma-B regulation protein RsbU (phosphoserine phosphatase)
MSSMGKSQLINGIEVPKKFIDVLYLTSDGQIPQEIRRLIKHKGLSFLSLSIDRYKEVRERLSFIGTVIIDVADLDMIQQQRLAGIIESLEMENIGVILLTDRMDLPVRSFYLAPTKISFSMASSVESVSIEDLWIQISSNLAFRKKSPGIAVKPPISAERADKNGRKNRLADQLRMTGALVENLIEQLHLASLVQQDFLPAELPNIDNIRWATMFLPAEWVSGDIYNVVRVDENHIGFYVADVVGHGIPAALLTIFLKQALVMRQTNGNSYRILEPAEVMNNLNLRMASQKLSGYQFATCCYCLLNTETLELTYARAGHPYPILIKQGRELKQLQIRGSLLGVFVQAEYPQEKIQLEPGDKLILYSDGAEPFIGHFDDQIGFRFNEGFYEMMDLPISEMVAKFNNMVKEGNISQVEVDDLTIVGLDIL